ncbi:DUF4124 domain-containing protein [Wenzhouxiangella sp. EGI_FJ10305]|uniref:DUF4124 domain-containing protein n=1 Tax=Wenzhouxiangella sp. EGI_FJ10305 TaxID=3243768 RepID=UPI0035E311BE
MNKLLILLTALLATLAVSVNAQDVYRVVDENGNVTYTDQKPDDNAEPMELPELNVLEGDEDTLPGIATEGENAQGQGEAQPMNFRIEQPADNTEITPGSEQISIVMGIDIEVPPTAQITLVLDGRELTPVRTLQTDIPAPSPGEHRLFARLETPSGRVLGTTDPVTFTTVAPDGD